MESISTVSPVVGERARTGFVADLATLFKARLTAMVLISTAVGFYLGSGANLDWAVMIHTLGGTALLAAGAAALNQYLEREHDARMRRTAERPLPAGRMNPRPVLLLGGIVSMLGMWWLTVAVNPLTGLLGVLTLVSYLFVYTPLKRMTTLNTLVGAVPGALPALMGWTGASGAMSAGGWSLFAILFFWQLPHFMAIAWLYREDYGRAGYRMLSVFDPTGHRTAATAIRHTIALLAFSLAPFSLGLVGRWYLLGALAAGLAFLGGAIGFSLRRSPSAARWFFFASIIYLPLLLGLLVMDRTPR